MNKMVIPIGIDINEVHAVFGCKDEIFFNRLLTSDFYKKFDDELSFKKELYDILFNYVPIEKRIIIPPKLFGLIKEDNGRGLKGQWNDYGYALLTICSYLGEKFSTDNSEFIYGESWWQINTLLRENNASFDLSRMLESKQIFDTPFEYDDIYTNLYNKKEIEEFVSHIKYMEQKIKKENLLLFNSLKNGLLNCHQKNLDLLVFSHEI